MKYYCNKKMKNYCNKKINLMIIFKNNKKN